MTLDFLVECNNGYPEAPGDIQGCNGFYVALRVPLRVLPVQHIVCRKFLCSNNLDVHKWYRLK